MLGNCLKLSKRPLEELACTKRRPLWGIYYLRGGLKKINGTIPTWYTQFLVLITPNNILARPKESWAQESENTRNPVKVIYQESYLTWIMTRDALSFCNHRACVFIRRYKNSSERKEHIQEEGHWRNTHIQQKRILCQYYCRPEDWQHLESYSESLVFINFQRQGPSNFLWPLTIVVYLHTYVLCVLLLPIFCFFSQY